jgi:hypothetical protein
MIYYAVLCCTILYFTVLLIIISNFYKLFRLHLRHITGYVQDIRTDEYFRKATIIGEIQSMEKDLTPEQRMDKAYERSAAIVTDVLLQNGYDPRQYNLKGLILLQRIQLGMQPVPGVIDRSVKPPPHSQI